jgi:hypothetical protein
MSPYQFIWIIFTKCLLPMRCVSNYYRFTYGLLPAPAESWHKLAQHKCYEVTPLCFLWHRVVLSRSFRILRIGRIVYFPFWWIIFLISCSLCVLYWFMVTYSPYAITILPKNFPPSSHFSLTDFRFASHFSPMDFSGGYSVLQIDRYDTRFKRCAMAEEKWRCGN